MNAFCKVYMALGLLIFSFCLFIQQGMAQDIQYRQSPERFSREELAQMLAPIALYPDVLLSQILMASTYPIEVIEAERWIRRNPRLAGTDLDVELLDRDWAPSVKALCHFPQVLVLMSEYISLTSNIGNAFLRQEEEVMDIVQELRARAFSQGNLVATGEQKIVVFKETIIIEPADPRVIYVPYYDSRLIYGSWKYSKYPPYSWMPGDVRIVKRISYWPSYYIGFSFGTWCAFDWQRRFIYIDVHKRPRYIRRDHWGKKDDRWSHDSRHRHGVSYQRTFDYDQYFKHPGRSGSDQHDRRDHQQKYDRGFIVPDRSKPWDVKGSKFQVPDRTMPWGSSPSTYREQEKRDRGKTGIENDQYKQGKSWHYRRLHEENVKPRQLWNMENFPTTEKNSPSDSQPKSSEAYDHQDNRRGSKSKGGVKVLKKGSDIKPGLKLK